MELKKLQFRIKDFHQISNIHENKFRPVHEAVNIPAAIDDVA
jgi:hypothetical protein